MTLLLPNDKVCELFYTHERGHHDVVMGYVLSTPPGGEAHALDQVQRWILFSQEPSDFFPRRELKLRWALDTGWSAATTKEAFITKARDAFQTTYRYVKVNCGYKVGTSTAPTMRPIPAPACLNTPGGSFQADIGTTPIDIQAGLGLQRGGYLYTVRLNTEQTMEYWVLSSNYVTPSSATDLVRVGGPLGFAAPEQFANLFDHSDGPTWGAGSTLLVAMCQEYNAVPGTGNSDVS